jgi:hypothetical protein
MQIDEAAHADKPETRRSHPSILNAQSGQTDDRWLPFITRSEQIKFSDILLTLDDAHTQRRCLIATAVRPVS